MIRQVVSKAEVCLLCEALGVEGHVQSELTRGENSDLAAMRTL